MIEPNCDMPWDIYLDWLQDQGNEDLRFIDPACFICVNEFKLYHSFHSGIRSRGEGYHDRIGYFSDGTEDFSPLEGFYQMGSHVGEGPTMRHNFQCVSRGDGSL